MKLSYGIYLSIQKDFEKSLLSEDQSESFLNYADCQEYKIITVNINTSDSIYKTVIASVVKQSLKIAAATS